MTMKMNSEILAKAADVMRERGHVKLYLEKFNGGPVCLVGAINVATHDRAAWPNDDDDTARVRALARIVGEFVDDHNDGYASMGTLAVVDWNNRPERTADEVIEALECAASAAASDEEVGL